MPFNVLKFSLWINILILCSSKLFIIFYFWHPKKCSRRIEAETAEMVKQILIATTNCDRILIPHISKYSYLSCHTILYIFSIFKISCCISNWWTWCFPSTEIFLIPGGFLIWHALKFILYVSVTSIIAFVLRIKKSCGIIVSKNYFLIKKLTHFLEVDLTNISCLMLGIRGVFT